MLFDLLSRCLKQRDFLDNECYYKWTSSFIENILYGDLISGVKSNSESQKQRRMKLGRGKSV